VTRTVVLLSALAGAALGLGAFTFIYARGYSYLTNDPAACANCHVMRDHYASWVRGPHHATAVCNDCHTPHALVPKYLVKAENGFRHSFAFTTGWFPEPIRITPGDRAVVENACRRCHAEIVLAIDNPGAHGGARLECVRCHWDVGHP
jgi:cytochrome c nitrite reductase small subunit